MYELHTRFPEMVLVDLGCNVGVFTLPAAKMGMEASKHVSCLKLDFFICLPCLCDCSLGIFSVFLYIFHEGSNRTLPKSVLDESDMDKCSTNIFQAVDSLHNGLI